MDQAQLNWITNFIWGIRPLRKNMGKKNCELAAEDIQRICDTFLAFEETPQSKIFPNAAFGYWKVKVERPLRLHSQLTRQRIEPLRYASGDEDIRAALYADLGDALFNDPTSVRPQLEKLLNDWGKADSEGEEDEEGEADTPKKSLSDKKKKKLPSDATWKRDAMLLDVANKLRKALGEELFEDNNVFLEKVEAALKKLDLKPSAAELKLIVNAVSWREETAPRVIAKLLKEAPDELRGRFPLSTVGHSQIKNQKSKASALSPTANSATSSKSRCWNPAASKPSSAAKFCPTRPTPGSSRPTQNRLRN